MCDCFHLAFPNWHADASGTGGRRLRAPEPGTEDDSTCDEPSQFTERERPRPQGSSPVEEFPEKYTDSDKECEAEHDPHHKSGSGKKTKKSGLGSMFEKRSTPKMSKLKEVHSPESGVIVKTAKDGCAEGLVYGGGGKEGIFIKEVVPESPASKSLKLKEGDQILSATVYFDNVSYEDAIQILEHAQAYKVKLCLKRKPDITETEPVIESDVIPEEDVYAPEMREQGKTKRRSDARISWPKFPSFGKGRKSRFTRSHSSSEADEQRKLELSPTTSDTESPIKSQDALKGKKKHKMKLSVLPKRGRISSSEDQDTDAPTTLQMLSPDCIESPSGEAPQVYVTENLQVVEDLRQLTESETEHHKVELITVDGTLKTEDLTVALAGQESPAGNKSPDGKRKKKERSELKMRILGKDKTNKKAKSSPKRLKTLGASIEIADQPQNEKSDVIPSFESYDDQLAFDASTHTSAKSGTAQMEISVPKVELEISDVELMRKSPEKGEEKAQKGKTAFKLPKIGFTDIDSEETIPNINVNVEEGTIKIEQPTTEGREVKEDPYERLTKSSLSRTKLPKREDIEIPGMEDKSLRTKAKGIKEPKAIFTGHYEDIQADTVQMSIDVDSVKEAVSKLPGYKLPKVDTSGVPIPEEITVIDANAQRISVKTPTKTKHDAHFGKFDISATPEISKTTVKLPKISPAGFTSEEYLMVTHVKQSDKEVYKREHIIIPGKESAQEEDILQTQETQGTEGIESEYQSTATFKSKRAKITMPSFGITKPEIKIPDVGIYLQKGDNIKGQKKIVLQEAEVSKTELKNKTGEVISDVKIPEIDGIEYIDSVDGSPAKKDGGIRLTGVSVNLNAESPKADISFPGIRGEIRDVEAEGHTFKLPKFGAVNVPDANEDIIIDGAEIRTLEREGKGGKFKIPNLGISMPTVKGPTIDVSLSKKDVTLPEAKAEVEFPEVTLGKVDVSIPDQKIDVEKPELEIKPWQVEGELDGQGSKFKKQKFGIKMPKLKGPEFDLSVSKKDVDTITLPEAKAEIKLPKTSEIDVDLGNVDVSIPEQKMEVQKPELEIKTLRAEGELRGQGGKFKLPEFGVKMPKIKGPEFDFSLSKKDGDVTLPEAKTQVKLPDVEHTEPSIKVEVNAPGIAVSQKDVEGSPSKFKMPTFKLPTFGVGTPNVSVEGCDMDKDVKIAGADFNRPVVEVPSVDIEGPSIDIKATETDHEGKGGKFKMPHLGFAMPKVKGPKFNLSSSKKDVDVTLPEASAEVKVPEAPKVDASLGKAEVLIPEAKVEVRKPEVKIRPLQTDAELEGQGGKFQMPTLGFKMPKVKGPEIHFGLSKKDGDVTLPEAKAEVELPEAPKVDVSLGKADVSLPKGKMEVKKPELEMKPLQGEVEIDGQGSKFKMPKLGMSMPKVKGPEFHFGLSKKDGDVTLPEAKAEVKVPDAPEVDVSLGKADVSLPKGKIEVKKPELEIKPLHGEVEIDGQGSKLKMPKLGMSMPKVKGPEFHFGLSKKDGDVTLSEAKAEVKVPDAPEVDVSLGKADVSLPKGKIEVKKPELEIKPLHGEVEIDGHGSKFKMPKLGMSMPKVKGPEFHFGLSKKDGEVTLPEANAEVELPEAPKMSVDMKSPECEGEIDGQGGKFKMPKLGMSVPKVKGPEFHFGLSKKDGDVTLPEAKAEIKAPEVELKEPSAKVEIKAPEIKVGAKGKEGSPSKFKMPTFKLPKFGVQTPNVSVDVPDMDTDVKMDGADINIPDEGSTVHIATPSIDIEGPSTDIKTTGVEQDGKGSKFKMPHLGFAMPKVKGPKMDVSLSKKDIDVKLPETKADVKIPEVDLGKVDVSIPDAKVEVTKPEMEMQFMQTEVELDGQGEKFKMPKFGIKMPKIKGPEFDLSLSKKDVDVKLPETKAEIQHPDAPEIDVNLGKAEVWIPETKVKVEKPELETEVEGQGIKLKMPKFGMSMPKVKGPEFHLGSSKKDVDVTLPEAKVDVNLPDVELIEPSAKVEVKAPEIEVVSKDTEGSPSKFKMPNFSFSMPKVKGPNIDLSLSKKDIDIKLRGAKAEIKHPEAPKIDVSLGKAEVLIPEAKVEVKKPEVEIKPFETDIELEGHKGKFQMPKFGITMPKVKGPDVDLSFSKKDVDVTLPGVKAEVELPEAPQISVDMKPPECEGEIDGQGTKFKMPKFGISLPKVKGPEVDLSLSKKDTDVTLPEAKVEVELPEAPKIDVDMKPPECEGEIDGQGGKFKMPKFGISMPKVKGPEIDFSLSKKNVDITLPEAKAEVNLPDVELKDSSAKVEVKAPEIEAQVGSMKGSPSKFKLPTFKFPKFGAVTPNVSAEVPDIDKELKIDGGGMHISVPHTDVDVPEVTAEVHLPEVQVKNLSGGVVIEQQPDVEVDAKLKKPRFSLPRFSFSKQSVKAPEVDASLQDVDVAIPGGKVEVRGGEVDVKLPECEAEVEGSKFKMPKFGITMPKVSGPEIDLSLSKKDVDVTLPEAKAEVEVLDAKIKPPSATVEIKAPKIDVQTGNVEGSPSKFKMPTFTLPKFGVATPKVSVEIPDVDKDIKIDGATVDVTGPSIDTEGLSVDVKAEESELEGSGSKFKIPKFGISMPKVKGPEIDLSLSKKDVDVTLPEAKAEIKLPEVEVKEPEVEIKSPEIKIATKDTEGSPSKFKMPTFKLPKFGIGTPSATVEVPDMEKDIKIDGADIRIPEEVLAVEITAPSADIEGPSIDIKTTGTEHEGSKFKLPSFSFSGPQLKRPDIDLSLSKKDVDVTLPEAKAEVKLPDAELKEPSVKMEIRAPGIDVQTSNVEGSPSKMKMPTFKLPNFGAATPQVSVEVPDMDKDIKVEGVDVKLPEVKLPDVEIKEPMIEGDAKLRKTSWTMPRFSFSKTSVKAPEADVKIDVPKFDVTLPEAKADVHLPDIDIKESSGISIEGPSASDIDAKMKKPRFSLPRFSFSKQSSKESTVDASLPDVDVSLPERNVEVQQPELELKPPEVDVELEGQESKFKIPKFGISMPKVKGPDIDLGSSKKDVDITLPEAKAEVELPEVKIKPPSAAEIKASKIEVQTGNVEGSPSKLKMPTFTLPKFGAATPKVSVEVPDVDKDIKIDVTGPSTDTEGLSVDVKTKESELEGSGTKFKIPKFGISIPKVKGPEIDISSSNKDEHVTLPDAEAEIKLPNVEVKESEVEIKSPEIKITTKGTEGSPSKFKLPTFKLPKFGIGTPSATVEVRDMEKDIKIDGADVKIPEEVLAVDMAAPSVDIEGPSIDIKTTGTEHEGKGSKYKLPSLDLSVSNKDVDMTLPEAEVKLPEVKETEGAISVPDAPTVEVEKTKRPSWTFPKFSFSRTSGKAPDVDVNLETPKVDVTSPEVKAEVQGPSGAISVEGPPAAELDANLKKSKFLLPRFSFSKSSVKEPEISAELPRVDVCLPEGEVIVTQPEMKIKSPEIEAEHDGQGSKFKLPKFGIALSKAKGPEEDLNTSQKDMGITLPEVKAEVKLPEMEVKESSASVEIKSKDTEGSPSKFKMPTLKMPKYGVATYDVTAEAPDADKVGKTGGAKLDEDVTVNIKGPYVDIKTDVSKAAVTDAERPKTVTDIVDLASPSKLKLPSFGEILKSIDVEFDVPKAEQNLETSKEVHETDEPSGKQLEQKETKQDTTKSPERTGWFRFPKFGLSSPSEPAKVPDKDKNKDEESPAGEIVDEEISPTCSVQSSDAFADISSAMTSEHVGLSSSSPTKVTVKYSDPNAATGLGEISSNIVTSTTRTELISVEPNLPEKITILSSGVSSPSEDTLRLESGKIHVIMSNIQATPEAEHAKLLSAVQIQSAGGLPLESEANEAASWTVEDSQGGKRTVFERHLVRQTSSERSESKETIVITKQITRRFDSSEPISGETASSIQRLRETVHSEKMRFFDGVDK